MSMLRPATSAAQPQRQQQYQLPKTEGDSREHSNHKKQKNKTQNNYSFPSLAGICHICSKYQRTRK
ncbi:unnamed protein product [Ceratitis capitata]|uniref:(Mediterranean fruit fly) hypothetical protein n=1 Tax=Ceratitis capitata TaxID=7213 RepID=A0A811U3Q5_CERCA|nr:unnamed protein product [Ceratitis capitata]